MVLVPGTDTYVWANALGVLFSLNLNASLADALLRKSFLNILSRSDLMFWFV